MTTIHGLQLRIRCPHHQDVPPMNTAAPGDSECGACIAAELERTSRDLAEARRQLATARSALAAEMDRTRKLSEQIGQQGEVGDAATSEHLQLCISAAEAWEAFAQASEHGLPTAEVDALYRAAIAANKARLESVEGFLAKHEEPLS